MASLNATLAWAMPVRPEVLGAHLEAYFSLLPTLNALRDCHRFGINAPVSCLPEELLLCIEDILVQQERDEFFLSWKSTCRCFQSRCRAVDHLEPGELRTIRDELSLSLSPSDRGNTVTDDDMDDYLLYGGSDSDVYDKHDASRTRWQSRLRQFNRGDDGKLFNKQKILTHFGLGVWTESRRLGPEGDFSPLDPAETTLAYLKYPNASVTSHSADPNPSELEYSCDIDTSCAVRVQTHFVQPADAMDRFKRAMSILGLSACEHSSQSGYQLRPTTMTASEPTDTTVAIEQWPQLILLMDMSVHL